MFRLDEDKQPEKTPPREATGPAGESAGEPSPGGGGEAGPAVATAADAVVLVDRSVSPYLVMFHESTGYRAEQIRGLRNKLIAMNPDDSAKTLVVTSAQTEAGKTSTSINLAMAFAERERTPVILVDADMRSPSVERYLQLNATTGLSEVLLGSATLEQAVRPSGVSNLDILGAGSRLAVPSEILTSHRIEELYHRLKERYQYVIIDTPAVRPVTDASVLSACADGTLLIVRMLHTSKGQTKDAIRTLRELGANLLGTFVVAVRGDKHDSYGHTSWEGE